LRVLVCLIAACAAHVNGAKLASPSAFLKQKGPLPKQHTPAVLQKVADAPAASTPAADAPTPAVPEPPSFFWYNNVTLVSQFEYPETDLGIWDETARRRYWVVMDGSQKTSTWVKPTDMSWVASLVRGKSVAP
jgi:hypothetical protein